MTSLRQVIERDRKLRRFSKPDRIRIANGKTFIEKSSGGTVFYCDHCHAPVIDSARGRENHARRKPECREAMGQ